MSRMSSSTLFHEWQPLLISLSMAHVLAYKWKPSLDFFDGYGEKKEPETEMERDSLLDKYEIVPDIIPNYPKHVVQVEYLDARVKFGNFLRVNETRPDPVCTWPYEENERYVLLLIAPDGDKPDGYDGFDWQIYLITNIIGNNLTGSEMISDYIPPFATGVKKFNRYIYLVYKQPDHGKIIEYFENRLCLIHHAPRVKFRNRVFAARYGLGNPIAINFFLGEMLEKTTRANGSRVRNVFESLSAEHRRKSYFPSMNYFQCCCIVW